MDIHGSTALVTGANRGLGRVFVQELLRRGARAVYATARDADTVVVPDGQGRVHPLRLDITDPDQVDAAFL